MNWCDFCQTYHSSMSCYHPGRAKLMALEAELDKWRNWHPDDEDLRDLQIQAKGRDGKYMDSLAASAAYINALEARLRDLASRTDV